MLSEVEIQKLYTQMVSLNERLAELHEAHHEADQSFEPVTALRLESLVHTLQVQIPILAHVLGLDSSQPIPDGYILMPEYIVKSSQLIDAAYAEKDKVCSSKR